MGGGMYVGGGMCVVYVDGGVCRFALVGLYYYLSVCERECVCICACVFVDC